MSSVSGPDRVLPPAPGVEPVQAQEARDSARSQAERQRRRARPQPSAPAPAADPAPVEGRLDLRI